MGERWQRPGEGDREVELVRRLVVLGEPEHRVFEARAGSAGRRRARGAGRAARRTRPRGAGPPPRPGGASTSRRSAARRARGIRGRRSGPSGPRRTPPRRWLPRWSTLPAGPRRGPTVRSLGARRGGARAPPRGRARGPRRDRRAMRAAASRVSARRSTSPTSPPTDAALDVLVARRLAGLVRGVRRVRRGPLICVLDPIDGSTNFDRGIPYYATSMCVVDERRAALRARREPRDGHLVRGGSWRAARRGTAADPPVGVTDAARRDRVVLGAARAARGLGPVPRARLRVARAVRGRRRLARRLRGRAGTAP